MKAKQKKSMSNMASTSDKYSAGDCMPTLFKSSLADGCQFIKRNKKWMTIKSVAI